MRALPSDDRLERKAAPDRAGLLGVVADSDAGRAELRIGRILVEQIVQAEGEAERAPVLRRRWISDTEAKLQVDRRPGLDAFGWRDRKSTRLHSSTYCENRMPSSA